MTTSGETGRSDWVRSDVPHEGDYARVNENGDLCFYSRKGRCDTRIPAGLLASFCEWLAGVPVEANDGR